MGVAMANAPGFLDDLTPAQLAAWSAALSSMTNRSVASATGSFGGPPAVVADGSPGLGDVAAIDWAGEPARVLNFLPTADPADLYAFFDWMTPLGQLGRALAHEEYLEWRVVRDAAGAIARVELTCEAMDYWRVLAAEAPDRLIALAAEFSGEAVGSVDVIDLFGVDPQAATPAERANNFAARNESGLEQPAQSNYNNGVKSILCMAQTPNTIAAAIDLAVFAAYPRVVREDGAERALTGPEAIATGTQSAVSCRNSDPTIVGVVMGAACAGQKVALTDPVGLYMAAFNRNGVTLNGAALPESWLTYSRGKAKDDNPLGEPLFQRLVIAPPPGSAATIGDLRDSNGDPVVTGGQLAREQHIQLYYRTTQPGPVQRIVTNPAPQPEPCGPANPDADRFAAWLRRFKAPPPTGRASRRGPQG